MSDTPYGIKLVTNTLPATTYLFDDESRGFKIVGSYWPHQGRPSTLPPISQCYEATSVECAAWFRVPAGSTSLPSVPLGHNTYFTAKFPAADGVYDYYQYFYIHKLVLQELVPSDGFSEDGNRYGMNIRDTKGNLVFTTNREMAIISRVVNMNNIQTINNKANAFTVSEYLLQLSAIYPINVSGGVWYSVTGINIEPNTFLAYNKHPREWRAIPTYSQLTEAQILNSSSVAGNAGTARVLLIARPLAYTMYKNF